MIGRPLSATTPADYRLNVHLPGAVGAALKQAATADGISVSEYVTRLIAGSVALSARGISPWALMAAVKASTAVRTVTS